MSSENQGSGHDPDATAHEVQGRGSPKRPKDMTVEEKMDLPIIDVLRSSRLLGAGIRGDDLLGFFEEGGQWFVEASLLGRGQPAVPTWEEYLAGRVVTGRLLDLEK